MRQAVAANEIVACLQAMGEARSNPVLDILDPQQPFIENHKYPPGKLTFAGSRWRAYYHSHGEPYRLENEHGHFHIFYMLDQQQWTHVAGLSMDRQGQPRQWFTTNRWVTDECWQDAEVILQHVEAAAIEPAMKRVERWLLAMLHLYQDDITQLLQSRDQAIQQRSKQAARDAIFEDRDVYFFSESKIDLLNRLTEILSKESGPEAINDPGHIRSR
ncbi:MAG: hypothetical protein PVJ63_11735 [Thioalkalispiraceae bacterium]|jgi:hypothetical protein